MGSPQPLAHSTAAIIAVYHPGADPQRLIDQLRPAVRHIVLVDNAPAGHPATDALRHQPQLTVLPNRNIGGLAGAYNRACEYLLLTHADIHQVVLLDEDSDASTLPALLADPTVMTLLHADTTAAVAPAYRDRATGLRGKPMRLRRWGWQFLAREFDGVEPVSFIINSMSVWRVAALRQLGPFDESLRVDHVDTEYCLRARRAGLGLYVAGAHEFAHSIGERRRFRLFGREMQAGGHSAARRYLIGRNTAWLARRHLLREPAFAGLCVARLGYEVAGILLAEPGRLAKLSALLWGAMVGLLAWKLT
ncbi:MAG: hypothetical protein HY855_23615 [Burkholderiales bacterium]|nr:hypothetical protein [Burkholderiales bacterium]